MPIVVTSRDLLILRHVARHRFLRSTQIVALLGAESAQGVLRRLQKLYHHGYLDRPRAQIDYHRSGGGSMPMVYALGNAGAALLAEQCGIPRAKVDWTAKNRNAGREFLDHALDVATVMTGLTISCRAHGTVRLIEPEDILARAPAETQHRRQPFGWRVRVSWGGVTAPIGVVPDKVFGLEYLQRAEGGNRAYFFLEVDRGTMPVTRRFPRQTSVLRKLLGYAATQTQGVHTAQFGIRRFRVLTVTTSLERMESMIAAYRAHIAELCPPSVFLFADKGSVAAGDVLSMPWVTAGGEEVRLGLAERFPPVAARMMERQS